MLDQPLIMLFNFIKNPLSFISHNNGVLCLRRYEQINSAVLPNDHSNINSNSTVLFND